MEILLIGVGGACGGLARFRIGKRIAERSATIFPVGTFIINVSGALLLGMVSAGGLPESWIQLLGTGFLGAFTTFSTFMYEGLNLFQEKENRNAVLYIGGTLVLGMAGYFCGFTVVHFLRGF